MSTLTSSSSSSSSDTLEESIESFFHSLAEAGGDRLEYYHKPTGRVICIADSQTIKDKTGLRTFEEFKEYSYKRKMPDALRERLGVVTVDELRQKFHGDKEYWIYVSSKMTEEQGNIVAATLVGGI